MASVKMTFSLDEATAARLRQASEALHKPKSEVVRDAIQDYAERLGRLSETEQRRLLRAFDELVPAIPAGSASEVEAELHGLRHARKQGGRRSPTGPSA
jgi:hypothetical protein